MRTVFLGTSRFAAAVLAQLAGAPHHPGPHRPLLVLTRPDRPAGRGRRLHCPPVAHAARALGIELAQPASVNDEHTRALLARARPEAVVVCAFGALIKEPLLSDHEMLNVHPSLLPRWRGAAPIERAIMAGDSQTGVSIMRLTAGLDSGPVCAAAGEPIEPHDTYGSLAPRLELLGAELLRRALDSIQAGEPLPFVDQDDARATYAEKIAAADRLLDPARSAIALERVARALHPHIGARLALPDGTLLGVIRARALPEAGALPAGATMPTAAASPAGATPAGALAAVDGRLLYGTARGALELLEVQPPGKRSMDAAAYLRGHAV